MEKCDVGYRLVNGSCVDIDECVEKTTECDKRASCLNTIGNYQCVCEDGFTGDGKSCTRSSHCSDVLFEKLGIFLEISGTLLELPHFCPNSNNSSFLGL